MRFSLWTIPQFLTLVCSFDLIKIAQSCVRRAYIVFCCVGVFVRSQVSNPIQIAYPFPSRSRIMCVGGVWVAWSICDCFIEDVRHIRSFL